MSIIIEKTYELIDNLENSKLVSDLVYYKNKLLLNEKAILLIKKINQTDNNKLKINYKKKLFLIDEYKKYIELYNELHMIIFKINRKYFEYTNTKECK